MAGCILQGQSTLVAAASNIHNTGRLTLHTEICCQELEELKLVLRCLQLLISCHEYLCDPVWHHGGGSL